MVEYDNPRQSDRAIVTLTMRDAWADSVDAAERSRVLLWDVAVNKTAAGPAPRTLLWDVPVVQRRLLWDLPIPEVPPERVLLWDVAIVKEGDGIPFVRGEHTRRLWSVRVNKTPTETPSEGEATPFVAGPTTVRLWSIDPRP